MEKRWVFKDVPEAEKIKELSSAINVNPVLTAILLQRNHRNFQEAKQFFRPSLENLCDPFLMKDMNIAVDRINRSIERGERILIYGDYDVDGTTAVALFFGFLTKFYTNCDFYLPDRYKEGYGISSQAIQWAIEEEFDLIISLDCGIKAIHCVQEAKDAGIDFIICDHHLPGEILPPAYAVLDPKQESCDYPFKELTGCGIGFKLLHALCIANEWALEKLYECLDLVAVSIAADIVPIIDENRILAYHGLKKLNDNPRAGLRALIKLGGLKDIGISDVVFGIGPRINAAGRISHARFAVDLLLCEDELKAAKFSERINEDNITRRDFDLTATEEALKLIDNDTVLQKAKSTVLLNGDWHKGVIGIVASRCMEKYYRPTIILTKSNGVATGSARSVNGFDVYEAISKCSDLLQQFGGHMYAAGLTLDVNRVSEFQERFEEIVSNTISEDMLVPQLEVDHQLNFDRINFKFYDILRQMAPFGPGNMNPVFVSENVYAPQRPAIIKDAHLKLFLKQKNNSTTMEAIAFNMADYFEMIESKMRFKVAYTIGENTYMDYTYLQLCIKDIKFD